MSSPTLPQFYAIRFALIQSINFFFFFTSAECFTRVCDGGVGVGWRTPWRFSVESTNKKSENDFRFFFQARPGGLKSWKTISLRGTKRLKANLACLLLLNVARSSNVSQKIIRFFFFFLLSNVVARRLGRTSREGESKRDGNSLVGTKNNLRCRSNLKIIVLNKS